MAKLIRTAMETNPYNDAGAILFAYFEGTPSRADLRKVIKKEIDEEMQEWAEPEKMQTGTEKEGVERWLIGDPG
jgi:hypothetical protein